MHILEIISTEIPPEKAFRGNFRSSKVYHDSEDNSLSSDRKQLGSGHYSTAKANKDPHLITKYKKNFSDTEKDPYWEYVDMVINNKLWENPYFPRIYKKHTYVDQKNQKLPKVEMEKLDGSATLNKKEVEYLIEKIVDPSSNLFSENVKSHFPEDKWYPYNMTRIICRIIMANVIGFKKASVYAEGKEIDIDTRIKDTKLIQAIKALIEFRKYHPTASVDLHTGNVMVRRGPTGVQLVLTDPFS